MPRMSLISYLIVYTVDSEIFANSMERHISDVKNMGLRQDLHISINDRVILPFREGFIFTKLRMQSFTKIKSWGKTSEFTVTDQCKADLARHIVSQTKNQ